MKQKLLIFAAFLLLTLGVQAQSLWDSSHPDHAFTFGVRAGLNFASTDMDNATSSRTGFHFGGTVDWNIVKSLSVSSGLYYVEKGFKSEYGKGSMRYLQVPLLASYRLETPKGVMFHLNAGPYFAWGVGGKVDYAPYDLTFTYNYRQDSFGDKGFFKHADMGLSAGLYILIKHVVLGFNYELGLADISKVYGKFHNRNTCFTVGYNF